MRMGKSSSPRGAVEGLVRGVKGETGGSRTAPTGGMTEIQGPRIGSAAGVVRR